MFYNVGWYVKIFRYYTNYLSTFVHIYMEHPVEIPWHHNAASHYSYFQLTRNKYLKLPPMTRVHKSRLTKKSNV